MSPPEIPSPPPVATEVAVVGAGDAGMILALALARAGVPVAMIGRAGFAGGAGVGDPRVFALSAGSRRVLEGLGPWRDLAALAEPVTDIVVADRAGPPLVHFDHAELDAGALGHTIAATALHETLRAALGAQAGIAIRESAVAAVDLGADAVTLTLADGGTVHARLAVGADGRDSRLRRAAGINLTRWDYDQTAIVLEIAHTRPHRGVAEERFLSGGPFAVLPLPDAADGGHRSFVIWSERGARAADLMRLGKDDFAAELARRLGTRLGAARSSGPRRIFPLALGLAEHYVAHRLALIGDAAHAVHPVAGQGLNLGIRDAAALAEVIVDARRLGLDIGMKTLLLDYERWRRFDDTCVAAATDLIERAFAPDNALVAGARRAGMKLLDRVGPARRLFMKEAMGLAGDLPRLVRGEPL